MTTLYLVRHGETADNARQIMQGQTQGELNEQGVAQAKALRDRLKVTKIETKSDGTVIETTTWRDGSTTVAETKPDGSVSTVEKRADGTEIKTAQPVSGEITASVSVPKSVGSTLTSTFTSCVSDDEVGQHTTYFYPVRPNGMEFYADQVSDTTVVVSTDDWTAAVRNLIGDEGWLKITPEKASVAAGGMLYQTMKFQFSANKTGKARQAQVEVDVKTDKIDGMQK